MDIQPRWVGSKEKARLRISSSPSFGDGTVVSFQRKSVSLMIPWGRAASSHWRLFSSDIDTPAEQGALWPFSELRTAAQLADRNWSRRTGAATRPDLCVAGTRTGREPRTQQGRLPLPVQASFERGTNIEREAAAAIPSASTARPAAKPPVACFR